MKPKPYAKPKHLTKKQAEASIDRAIISLRDVETLVRNRVVTPSLCALAVHIATVAALLEASKRKGDFFILPKPVRKRK